MQERLDQRIDRRLDRIQFLLEEGNQNLKESNEKVVEELEQLHFKVDRVQDTVTYIKKNITTVTPYRLACLLILAIVMWTWSLYFFEVVKTSSSGT